MKYILYIERGGREKSQVQRQWPNRKQFNYFSKYSIEKYFLFINLGPAPTKDNNSINFDEDYCS